MNNTNKLCYFRMEKSDENYNDIIKENLFEKNFIFYNKYKIDYNNNHLNIELNEDYIEDFYSINDTTSLDITGIIGKNGTGKTALISFIINSLYSNIPLLKKCIMVLEINGILNIFYNEIKIENLEYLKRKGYIFKEAEGTLNQELYNVWRNISTIYYSESVNFRNDLIVDSAKGRNYFNLSLYNNIKLNFNKVSASIGEIGINEGFRDTRFCKDDFVEIKRYLTKNNLKYIIEKNDFNIETATIEMPLYLNNKFDYSDYTNKEWKHLKKYTEDIIYKKEKNIKIKVQVKPTEIEKSIYKRIIDIFENESEETKRSKLMIQFAIIDIYFYTLYGIVNNKECIGIVNNELSKICFDKNEDIQKTIKKIFDKIENIKGTDFKEKLKKEQSDTLSELESSNLFKTIKQLNKECNKIFKIIDRLYNSHKEYFLLGRVFSGKKEQFFSYRPCIRIPYKDFCYIEEILDEEKTLIFNMFEVNLKGLSSGQQALLDMFSKIFNIIDKINTESILIIMDEPELYFHPEWQRKLIYNLIEFLNKHFSEKSIQLIISSNSPYILSDLQDSDVILLGNKANNTIDKTFANNIYYLLKNEYFMDFTIGEFSKQKIEYILQIINGDESIDKKKYLKIKKIIDLIGDEILRNKLSSMLEEKYDKN